MAKLSLIRDLCKKKGITLSKLAEDLDITFSGLQSLMKKNTTKIDTLEKIANYLNVPVSQFFENDPSSRIYFSNNDGEEIRKDIEKNKLEKYQSDILSFFNFVKKDGRFIFYGDYDTHVTKEKVINGVFERYIEKEKLEKEIEFMHRIIADKEKIIDFQFEKLNSQNNDNKDDN